MKVPKPYAEYSGVHHHYQIWKLQNAWKLSTKAKSGYGPTNAWRRAGHFRTLKLAKARMDYLESDTPKGLGKYGKGL